VPEVIIWPCLLLLHREPHRRHREGVGLLVGAPAPPIAISTSDDGNGDKEKGKEKEKPVSLLPLSPLLLLAVRYSPFDDYLPPPWPSEGQGHLDGNGLPLGERELRPHCWHVVRVRRRLLQQLLEARQQRLLDSAATTTSPARAWSMAFRCRWVRFSWVLTSRSRNVTRRNRATEPYGRTSWPRSSERRDGEK